MKIEATITVSKEEAERALQIYFRDALPNRIPGHFELGPYYRELVLTFVQCAFHGGLMPPVVEKINEPEYQDEKPNQSVQDDDIPF